MIDLDKVKLCQTSPNGWHTDSEEESFVSFMSNVEQEEYLQLTSWYSCGGRSCLPENQLISSLDSPKHTQEQIIGLPWLLGNLKASDRSTSLNLWREKYFDWAYRAIRNGRWSWSSTPNHTLFDHSLVRLWWVEITKMQIEGRRWVTTWIRFTLRLSQKHIQAHVDPHCHERLKNWNVKVTDDALANQVFQSDKLCQIYRFLNASPAALNIISSWSRRITNTPSFSTHKCTCDARLRLVIYALSSSVRNFALLGKSWIIQ